MSFANAQEAITALSGVNATETDIIDFIRQLSVDDAPGSITVLYSGEIKSKQAWEIVESMGDDVRHVGQTMAAEVLDSDAFKIKVAQVFEPNLRSKRYLGSE